MTALGNTREATLLPVPAAPCSRPLAKGSDPLASATPVPTRALAPYFRTGPPTLPTRASTATLRRVIPSFQSRFLYVYFLSCCALALAALLNTLFSMTVAAMPPPALIPAARARAGAVRAPPEATVATPTAVRATPFQNLALPSGVAYHALNCLTFLAANSPTPATLFQVASTTPFLTACPALLASLPACDTTFFAPSLMDFRP